MATSFPRRETLGTRLGRWRMVCLHQKSDNTMHSLQCNVGDFTVFLATNGCGCTNFLALSCVFIQMTMPLDGSYRGSKGLSAAYMYDIH